MVADNPQDALSRLADAGLGQWQHQLGVCCNFLTATAGKGRADVLADLSALLNAENPMLFAQRVKSLDVAHLRVIQQFAKLGFMEAALETATAGRD